MNTPLLLIEQAERLVQQIARLQPPKDSRHAKVQKRAYVRYVRRFKTVYIPVAAGRSPAGFKATGQGRGAL